MWYSDTTRPGEVPPPKVKAVAQRRKSGFQISYVTITYRSVFLGILLLLALVALGMSFAFPAATGRVIAAGETGFGNVLTKVGLGSNPPREVEPGPQQAHFTNIDGTVRVKKAGSNTWVQADYSLALEKNDVVQTSPEGIAKIVFTDGTNYTVKPDSLIVIQENYVDSSEKTRVAVQVTTGTVDLATSNIKPGSKSQVSVAGAVANLASDSSAQVMNDPRNDEHAIVMKTGFGEVARGDERENIGANEKLSFTDEGEKMVKTKEIPPPVLINPATPEVSLGPEEKGVTFSWSPVDGVRGYHVSVARNQFFKPAVFDRTVTGEQVALMIPAGAYYWKVQSLGQDGRESAENTAKFTLLPRATGNSNIPLQVTDLVAHGHTIEVHGKTEPGARVLINGDEAVLMPDGTFVLFTKPLPSGENMITITAQNAKGGVSNLSRPVTIQ